MVTRAAATPFKLDAWSFSRFRDHRTCPAFFKYKYIEKRAEPGNDAMQRGTDIHTLAENYVKGTIKKLPQELKLFEEEFAVLKKNKALAEGEWAFSIDWQPTNWFKKPGQPAPWVRIKIDVCMLEKHDNSLAVIDHKTGKFSTYKNPEYEEQLELYAIGGLLNFPNVDGVRPLLYFIDAGIIHPEGQPLVTHKELPKLKKKWETKVKPMFNETAWKPKPNQACKWCHFRKENGGPCQY